MGVSILPRLAATVCNTTSGTTSQSCPAICSTTSAKGTKVMRDTSLVMTMLQKKGRNTSTNSILRVVSVRRSRQLPSQTKSPAFWKPFITAIRLKSMARVSQSIYPA